LIAASFSPPYRHDILLALFTPVLFFEDICHLFALMPRLMPRRFRYFSPRFDATPAPPRFSIFR